MNENIFSNLDGLETSMSNIVKQLEMINDSCVKVSSSLQGINEISFNDIASGIGNVLNISSGAVSLIGSFDKFKIGLGDITGLLGAIPTPMIAVTGALTVATAAIAIFSNYESEATKNVKAFNEAQQQKMKVIDDTTKRIVESTNRSIDMSKTAEAQSTALRGFISNLNGLADENGYVKNFEQAQYYVDQINSAMPGTVSLTKEGKLEWEKSAEAIEKNIVQMERKAKVDAYYEGYVESLKKETELRNNLTLAQNQYNAELNKQQEILDKMDALKEKIAAGEGDESDKEKLLEYQEQLSESSGKLETLSEKLEKAKGAYDANSQAANLYNQALGALNGDIIKSAELQASEYAKMDETGKVSWDSLATGCEDCKERMKTAQGDELTSLQLTSSLLQAEMINKANNMGLSYDQMIQKLEDSGVKMSETEKKQLKDSYDRWNMSTEDIKKLQAGGLDTLKLMKSSAMSEMNATDKVKLSENVKLFASTGSESGMRLCQQLADNLEENNGKVDEKTRKILAQIENEAKKADPKTRIGVNAPTEKNLELVGKKISSVSKDRQSTVELVAKADRKSFKLFGFELPWFAEGGFPDTGELFVAREAGPELVGRIHGKTAVANNDQIISGISSGVYNAVTSAMQGMNTNGEMNIHATFVMDGEVVGKQVIKYHNGVVKRTGRSPLFI
jgi:hypothetical protein